MNRVLEQTDFSKYERFVLLRSTSDSPGEIQQPIKGAAKFLILLQIKNEGIVHIYI